LTNTCIHTRAVADFFQKKSATANQQNQQDEIFQQSANQQNQQQKGQQISNQQISKNFKTLKIL
jgi:hypothetical protein